MPGDQFGAYEIVRELGRGGMGAVYEAEHRGLRKRVALKVMLGEAMTDPAQVERFLGEGEAAARIRHEHIVDVTDVGVIGDVPYLVMEYLDGEALSARLQREGRIAQGELATLMLPVVAALVAAHEAGVVHRDLKPENIFLARDRRGRASPRIVDFGISRIDALDDSNARRLTGATVLVGTPCYMAPETARGSTLADARSDQFSFGVLLFECLTGRLPYARDTVFEVVCAILREPFPQPIALVPDLDPRWNDLVLRATRREPDARFPDMRAVGAAMIPLAPPEAQTLWSPEFTPRDVDLTPWPAAPMLRASAAERVVTAERVRSGERAAPSERMVPASIRPVRATLPEVMPRTWAMRAAGLSALVVATVLLSRSAAPRVVRRMASSGARTARVSPAPSAPVSPSSVSAPPSGEPAAPSTTPAAPSATPRRVTSTRRVTARRPPHPSHAVTDAHSSGSGSPSEPPSDTPEWMLRTRF